MTPQMAILMFLAPGAVVAVLLLAATFIVRREGEERPRPLAGRLAPPVVAVLAFWLADIGLNQFHPVWDRNGANRFLAVALAAGLAGLAHALFPRPAVVACVRGLLGAGIAAIVLSPLAGGQYVPWGVFVGLTLATALWLAVSAAAMDLAADRTGRVVGPAGMLLAATVAAPGLFALGYASGAQFFGTLSAMAGGLGVASLPGRSRVIGRAGLHTVWAAVFASILLVPYGYNELPSAWPLALIALAPLGLFAAGIPGAAWRSAAGTLVTVALVSGGATVAATLAAGEDDDADPYDYPYDY